MQPTDDGVLLQQYVEDNSDEAFAMLVTRHINLVYSVALRQIGDPGHAEEITQAVFIILARKAGQLRHSKAISSWLFQTTRLTANNFIRSERRRQFREQETHMQATLNESHIDIWPQIAPLLDDALAGLRGKDRQAVLLRFYEDKNLKEIGSILGASENAAEKRIKRSLEKLRGRFSKRGVDSTTAAIGETLSSNALQVAPVALAKTITTVAIAKGPITVASTLTLVKGTMKTMTWLKVKFALGLSVAILIAGGLTTVALSQPGSDDNLTPQEIIKKSQDTYAALSSYSDTGETVATLNGMTLTTTFTIKLARPGLYRIEWNQPVNPGYANKGIVWSAGQGDFMIMGDAPAQNEKTRESALSSATGISGSASATIPGTFFKMNWGNQLGGSASSEKQQPDEKVGDLACYVFSSELKGRTTTLWIGKKDFLIHQVRTVTNEAALKAALAQAATVIHNAPQPSVTGGITSTETHEHIVINQKFSTSDFQGPQ